ncbi:hypothetical protein CDAR_49591 [Caerostris darwini]|uniref:Uncharacterized protein n=1 Tax=Caerostris darwini TaxID=1538125 RepID=A0AAV4T9C6_9ARAC|nr:hypothetical protein CDAR_49591 [Caerostris darwini]
MNLSLSPSKTNFQSRKQDRITPKELRTNYIKLRYSLRPNYRPVLIVSLHAVRLEYNTNIGGQIEKGPIRVSRGYTGDSKGPSSGPLMAPLLEQLSISRPPHRMLTQLLYESLRAELFASTL